MIEVEIKFPLFNGNEERVLKNAELFAEKIVNDAYYDDVDFSLTLQDFWLRNRNDKFELKIPANPATKNVDHLARRYTELTNDKDILHALKLKGDLAQALKENGYHPIVKFKTIRSSYQDGNYRIDIDHTDFGYDLGEIELLVDDPSQTQQAEKELETYLSDHNVAYSHGHIGKVAHYLQKNNPDHFYALVEAGVINHEDRRKKYR